MYMAGLFPGPFIYATPERHEVNKYIDMTRFVRDTLVKAQLI